MLKHNGYITLPFTSLKEQLELEKDMRNRGINRFQKRLSDHKKRGEESFTNYGKTLLSNSIRPLSEAITQFVNEGGNQKGVQPISRRLLSLIEPDIASLITAKSIINSITIARKLTSAAINVASKIEDEVALRTFEESKPEHYGIVKTDLDKRSFGYMYKRRKLRESAQKNELEWVLCASVFEAALWCLGLAYRWMEALMSHRWRGHRWSWEGVVALGLDRCFVCESSTR